MPVTYVETVLHEIQNTEPGTVGDKAWNAVWETAINDEVWGMLDTMQDTKDLDNNIGSLL